MTNHSNKLVWLLVVLTILIRLVHLAEIGDDPSSQQPVVDSSTYHKLAIGLVEDGLLDEHFLYQAPLYPLFLSGIYRIFGISLLAVKLLQIILAGFTCLLTMRLARRLFNEKTGIIAGLMMALCGPLVFFDLQLLATPLAVFWMVALANLALHKQQNNNSSFPWSSLTLGMVGALAILTRPTFVPVVIILLVWPLRRRQLPFHLGIGIAGLAIIMVPFALTMQNLTGHTGLLPPTGAVNLYIGNNADFDETINTRIGLPWEKLLTEPMVHGYKPGAWNGQPYYRNLVQQFIIQEPVAFMRLLVLKTGHLLSSRELLRNVDIYVHRQYSNILSFLVFKVGVWGFPMALLWPLAALGIGVSGYKKQGPLVWMMLGYGAALVLVFIASRYRAPLLPLIIIFASHGLVWLGNYWQQRNWRYLASAGMVLAGMTLLVTLPGPFAQEKINLESELHYGVGWNYYQQENWAQAEAELRKAVLLDASLPEAHNFLGLVLVEHEQWQEAATHFQAAVQLASDYHDAVQNLKLCQSKQAEADYRRARDLEGSNPQNAIAIYEEILTYFPVWPEVLVRLAWMYAASSDITLRDGAKALRLLAKPSLATVGQEPYVLFVKSAALAENNEFNHALEVAENARNILGPGDATGLAKKLDRAILLYGKEKPWPKSP